MSQALGNYTILLIARLLSRETYYNSSIQEEISAIFKSKLFKLK